MTSVNELLNDMSRRNWIIIGIPHVEDTTSTPHVLNVVFRNNRYNRATEVAAQLSANVPGWTYTVVEATEVDTIEDALALIENTQVVEPEEDAPVTQRTE